MDDELDTSERLPPNDEEAEKAMLGSLLLDEGACRYYCDTFRAEFFYQKLHEKVFGWMQRLLEAGDAVDYVTVAGKAKPREADILHELVASVPSAANVDSYAKAVRAAWHRRKGVAAAMKMQAEYEDPATEPAEITQAGIQSLEDARQGAVPASWRTIAEVMDGWEGGAGERWTVNVTPELAARGWELRPGTLVFSGQWSAGKTTLILQILLEVAEEGNPVYIWSKDMSDRETALKMASCRSQKPEHRLKREDMDAVDALQFRFDSGEFDLGTILATLRIQAAQGVRWFMLDYVELLSVPGSFREAWQCSEEAVKRIKVLARDLDVYVLLLQSATKDDTVRGSNEIGHAGDQLWWIEKPEDDYRERDPFILRRKKHRKGTVGKAELKLIGEQSRFEDWNGNGAGYDNKEMR